jgi:hypothetical protein
LAEGVLWVAIRTFMKDSTETFLGGSAHGSTGGYAGLLSEPVRIIGTLSRCEPVDRSMLADFRAGFGLDE